MKIHTVIPAFYPSIGGAETHVYEINKELVRRKHVITVHTLPLAHYDKKLPKIDEIEGIKIRRYEPIFNMGFYLNFWHPQIDNCQIIDLQGYPSLLNSYLAFKHSEKYPIIFTPHHGLFAWRMTKFQSLLLSLYNKTIGYRTLKLCKALIAQTDYEKELYNRMGIGRVITAPSGLHDFAFESYNYREIKEKYNLAKYLLFLGRLYFEKAPCSLVKAFALIEKKYPNISLIFAGPDAGEAEKVRKLAKELGLEKRVKLTGRVSEEEKYQLLAGCEFLVLPSMCEAQGIVFIEAYAQGKTVIGTRVGGVPEVIRDNVTGLLVEYGDIKGLAEKMEYLLERPDICKEMGKKGKELAWQKYRWKDIIDRIERLYEEVIEERKKANR